MRSARLAEPNASAVLIDLAERLRRLAPSSRHPERFHEEKSEIAYAIRRLAGEVGRAPRVLPGPGPIRVGSAQFVSSASPEKGVRT